jgi:hypothetical protein
VKATDEARFSDNGPGEHAVKKAIILFCSHLLVALVGLAAGIYLLPIITAPSSPSAAALSDAVTKSLFKGEFRRDLADSDALHWGEGTVHVGREAVSLDGAVSPGPAYKLYLSSKFVETEAGFLEHKNEMALVGDVKTFKNFIVPMPSSVDPDAYRAVIVWCEAFDQFITAARYR